VLETVARMAPLLRVFARDGDRLWSPAPGPDLESGPLRDLPPAEDILAWCETPAVLEHRGGPRRTVTMDWDAPLHDLLWQLPTPLPSAVAVVHHRAFHLQVAQEIGCALPGARMVESLMELERLSLPRNWIIKAPLSASGRDRYIERDRHGQARTDPKAWRTVERLFERHGSLLFEPWMERVADYGVTALLTQDEMRVVGIHGQRVDRKGQFVGIDLQPDLTERDRDLLLETVEAVAAALRRAGYVGPFGIDAWSYKREDGEVVLNPLGEINARMTFGLVAWVWAKRRPLPDSFFAVLGTWEDERDPEEILRDIRQEVPQKKREPLD
jgi:hypothetical protein